MLDKLFARAFIRSPTFVYGSGGGVGIKLCSSCVNNKEFTRFLSVRVFPKTNDGLMKLNFNKRSYTTRNLYKLKERGLVSDVFPYDDPQKFVDFCNSGRQTVYAGFDPTADSLHVGNLAVMMMLLHCQRAGHKVIALVLTKHQ
jgi:hypothetical protein